MTVAAQELSSELPSDEATVSCDGTWQRRGFISKNGIATVLSVHQDLPAKVLDIHVASNHCDACVKAKKKMGEGEFEDWYEIHKSSCMKNHEGTSGKMESTGMLTIFRRSEQQYGLKCTGYLGDGTQRVSTQCTQQIQPSIEEKNGRICRRYPDTVCKLSKKNKNFPSTRNRL